MPELPEAETIVRGIRPAVVGRRISSVEIVHRDVLRERAASFRANVLGAVVDRVERRGKNVVIVTRSGPVIVVNLGMTGRLLPLPRGGAPPGDASHPAVRFCFESGEALVFDDTRRFGTVEALSPSDWAERSGRMGPEPLAPAFRARDLVEGLARSRSPVRSWLLDQRNIAGIGNIYANEALYLAGLHPQRPSRLVTEPECGKLHRALRRLLRNAIRAGGTTIRDYRTAGGEKGGYAVRLRVYGRRDEPCHRCGAPIRRVVFGGRSAFHCPVCQQAGDG